MLVTLLSALPFFSAFFWALILLLDEKTNNSKLFLNVFFFLIAINYFAHWLYFTKEYEWYAVFDHVWIFTSLSTYPMAYYYLRLLAKDAKFSRKWSWLFIAPLAVTIFSISLYLSASEAEKHIFIYGVMFQEIPLPEVLSTKVKLFIFRNLLFKIVFGIQAVLGLVFGYKILKEYDKKIHLFYSNVKDKNLKYAEKMLNLFIFATVVSIASSAIGKDYFIANPTLLFIPALTHTSFIFMLGFLGYRQVFTIQDFQKDLDADDWSESVDEPLAADENTTENQAIVAHLLGLMREEEIFRNPDLKITDLARMLNTNRTYISNILNDTLALSFSDFINDYRINFAKKLLKDKANDQLPLTQIAEMSGFSSDSTFYRVFKSKTNLSPGVYRSAQP